MEDGMDGFDPAEEAMLVPDTSDEALEHAGAEHAETINSHVSSFFLPPCC